MYLPCWVYLYSWPGPEQRGLHREEVQFVAAGLPEANSK